MLNKKEKNDRMGREYVPPNYAAGTELEFRPLESHFDGVVAVVVNRRAIYISAEMKGIKIATDGKRPVINVVNDDDDVMPHNLTYSISASRKAEKGIEIVIGEAFRLKTTKPVKVITYVTDAAKRDACHPYRGATLVFAIENL